MCTVLYACVCACDCMVCISVNIGKNLIFSCLPRRGMFLCACVCVSVTLHVYGFVRFFNIIVSLLFSLFYLNFITCASTAVINLSFCFRVLYVCKCGVLCVCAYCSSLRPRGNGSGSLVGSCFQSVTSHTHSSDPGRSQL